MNVEYETKQFKMQTYWNNDLVNEILAEISNYFYLGMYLNVLERIECKFPIIFNKFPEIKLGILKLEFFHLLLIKTDKETISQFYFESIHHLLQTNNKTQEILNNIMSQGELVSSKYYEIKCDEFIRLILNVLEITLIEIINPTRSLLQCNNVNEIVFKENIQKLNTFESELWFGFLSQNQQNENNIEQQFQSSQKSSPKTNSNFLLDDNEDSYMAHYYINYKCEKKRKHKSAKFGKFNDFNKQHTTNFKKRKRSKNQKICYRKNKKCKTKFKRF